MLLLVAIAAAGACRSGPAPAPAPIEEEKDGGRVEDEPPDFCDIGFGCPLDGGPDGRAVASADAGRDDDSASDGPLADGRAAAADVAARPDLARATAPCPFFPFKIGNQWLYRVASPLDAPYMKATAIVGMEPVPVAGPHQGRMALRVETRSRTGVEDRTISWQFPENDQVRRLAEHSFRPSTGLLNKTEYWVPYKLRLDEAPPRIVPGTTWTERYVEYMQDAGGPTMVVQRTDAWVIEALDDPITVPAGSFRALRFRKRTRDGDNGKTYWFARCVGKVLELGRTGKREELMDYRIVP